MRSGRPFLAAISLHPVHGCQHMVAAGMAGATMLGDVAGFLGRLAICLFAHAQRLGLFSRQAQVKGMPLCSTTPCKNMRTAPFMSSPRVDKNVIGAMEQFVVNGCTNNAHLMLSLVNLVPFYRALQCCSVGLPCIFWARAHG